jgi:hypothetical protein
LCSVEVERGREGVGTGVNERLVRASKRQLCVSPLTYEVEAVEAAAEAEVEVAEERWGVSSLDRTESNTRMAVAEST